MKKLILAMCAFALFFSSCTKDEDDKKPTGDYVSGTIVLNEGGFQKGNASVSFIKNDETVVNDIFAGVTGGKLGDTAQNIGFDDDKAYIVVNGSNKVEIVDRYSFKPVFTLEKDFKNPRYISFYGDKAYVTNWGDGSKSDDDFVTIINLKDYTTKTVSVPVGPEQILTYGGKLYIAHLGGFGSGNTVSVFDPSTEKITNTITVGDRPGSLVEEDNKLYVMCAGKAAWTGNETKGGIYQIDLSDNTVTKTEFADGIHPGKMIETDGKLYYNVGSAIYSKSYTSTTLPSSAAFTSDATTLYGLGAKDGKIFVGDAIDYASSGKVFIYDTAGTKLKEYTVGVLPNGFYFN